MARKYFYYVGVQNNNGMSFVTSIDNRNRMCHWDTDKKPLAMSSTTANDLAEGLMMNFFTAVVVKSFFELDKHFVSEEETVKQKVTDAVNGATSGGTKFTIKPEIKDIEVDGALVKVKGLTVKTGETAVIETNLVELTPDLMKMCIVGQNGTSGVTGYDVIESKRQIATGDYISNFGYIGKKLDGTPIIIIFDNALCTSGLEVEGKNKENGVFKATFECYANLSSEADILPYHIYYPTPSQS